MISERIVLRDRPDVGLDALDDVLESDLYGK
jgi:hypothetical protein